MDNIIGHSVTSLLKDVDLVGTAQIVNNPLLPNELFPELVLGLDVVAYFNLLNINLVRSSKEMTLLRARSNQNFFDFATSLHHLNQHQKYYLQQQLKEAFTKNRQNSDVVDKQFKAAVRVIYLYEYFGEAFILCPRFFTKKFLVGPHAE